MRKFTYTFLVGGLGGTLFLLVLLGLVYRANLVGLSSVVGAALPSRLVVREVKKEVVSVTADEPIKEAFNKAQESLVVVKTYQGGRLVRSGSGLMITQDGLILTVYQLVPSGLVYQVVYGDKILPARLYKTNANRNLALLKVEDNNLEAATLAEEKKEVGATLFVIGKLAPLRVPETFIHKVLVSRQIDSGVVLLEGTYSDELNGAALIDQKGAVSGLVFIDGRRILALQSHFLKDFLGQNLK